VRLPCLLFDVIQCRPIRSEYDQATFRERVKQSASNFTYNPIYYTGVVWPYEGHLREQMSRFNFTGDPQPLTNVRGEVVLIDRTEDEDSLAEAWATVLSEEDGPGVGLGG
jgi:hypothetical protein